MRSFILAVVVMIVLADSRGSTTGVPDTDAFVPQSARKLVLILVRGNPDDGHGSHPRCLTARVRVLIS